MTTEATLIAEPRDHEAETAVLASILVTSGRVLDDLELRPADMFEPAHEVILATAIAMHAEGKPVEAVTIVDQLRRQGDLQRVGGPVAITDLVGAWAIPATAPYYARIIRERAARRVIIAAAVRLQQDAMTPAEDVLSAVENARTSIDTLANRISGTIEQDYEADLDAVIDDIEHGVATVSTPWPDLDDKIGGWRRGAVYVAAARPGGGKSIVGVQAAVDMMQRHAKPVVLMSLEMTRGDVYKRVISQLGPVNLSSLAHGGRGVGADEWERIAKARGLMSELRFAVDDRSTVTVADIRGAVARCKRRHGSCGLLVVDYLQLVTTVGRQESRQTEVASISRALKVTAKEHDVPVLVLAQLNRAPEGANRPPRPSDLRESGAVEQDSDVVILLHRDAEQSPHQLQVGVGKNRHGPTGSFLLDWQGHYSRVTTPQWSPSAALQRGRAS